MSATFTTVPSLSFTLANTGMTAGTYDSASQVPILVTLSDSYLTQAYNFLKTVEYYANATEL